MTWLRFFYTGHRPTPHAPLQRSHLNRMAQLPVERVLPVAQVTELNPQIAGNENLPGSRLVTKYIASFECAT